MREEGLYEVARRVPPRSGLGLAEVPPHIWMAVRSHRRRQAASSHGARKGLPVDVRRPRHDREAERVPWPDPPGLSRIGIDATPVAGLCPMSLRGSEPCRRERGTGGGAQPLEAED